MNTVSSTWSMRTIWPAVAILTLCGLTALPVAVDAADTEQTVEPAPTTWTNDKGVPIEAEFVRMTDAGVVLRLIRDGREAAVPLTKLSIESIYQAVRLDNPQGFSKPIPKAETKPEGPELPELHLTVDDILQSPFTQSTSIEQFLETYERQQRDGNFFVSWHALPPKMQVDIEALIVAGHEQLGAATIKQIQTLLGELNTIASEKKKFVLGLPEVSNNPTMITEIDRSWPLLNSLTSVLSKEEHWQPSNFQVGSVPRWLATLSLELAPVALAARQTVSESLGSGSDLVPLEPPKHTIISQSADTAEVEVVVGKLPPQKKRYQKLGNIWIDVAAMNELRRQVDAAKEKMSEGNQQAVAAIKPVLGGLIAAVGGLARAQSQEEFSEAVNLLTTMTGGFTKNLRPNSPGNAGGGTPNNPYGSSSAMGGNPYGGSNPYGSSSGAGGSGSGSSGGNPYGGRNPYESSNK